MEREVSLVNVEYMFGHWRKLPNWIQRLLYCFFQSSSKVYMHAKCSELDNNVLVLIACPNI